MSHPGQLIEDFKQSMPTMTVHQWIYGLFNTTYPDVVNNQKGLLIASVDRLLFFPGKASETSDTFSIPFTEIESISSGLAGNTSLICHFVDGHNIEMAYISRGASAEFTDYLKLSCANLADIPLN